MINYIRWKGGGGGYSSLASKKKAGTGTKKRIDTYDLPVTYIQFYKQGRLPKLSDSSFILPLANETGREAAAYNRVKNIWIVNIIVFIALS